MIARQNCAAEWSYWAAPIVAGDLLVSGGDIGKLILLRPASGETAAPCAVEDGFYLATWDDRLRRYRFP
jgi:hypothetical protein